jgi:two-component system NtrC family sensor kinase
MAAGEGWDIRYLPGSYDEGIARLASAEADLMLSALHNDPLDARIEYSAETLIMDWSLVFVRPGVRINTVIDLGGATVAVVRDSASARAFVRLAEDFEVPATLLPFDTLDEAAAAAVEGRADALVASRITARGRMPEGRLRETPIIFSPIDIRFATPKERNADVLAAIDRNLREQREASGTVYHEALDRMFGAPGHKRAIPPAALWALAAFASLAVLLVAVALALRGMVGRRTRALRESERRYQSLFENMQGGFACHRIVMDEVGLPVDYVFTQVNSAFERLTGLKRGGVLGRRVTEVIPGIRDGEFDWVEEYGRVALGGGPARFEQYAEQLDRWYAVSAYSHEPGSFCTVFDDITKRKKSEAALFQAKQDWEDTFDTITDAITVHDKDFRIVRANRAASRLLDLNWIEMPRARCYEKFHGAGCPPEDCPSCRSLVSRERTVVERYEPHLGLHLEITAIPRLSITDEVVGLIHIVRDITERKRAERLLELRREALQSVYRMATQLRGSIDALCNETALSLARILGVRLVVVARTDMAGRKALSLAVDGELRDASGYDCVCLTAEDADTRGPCVFEAEFSISTLLREPIVSKAGGRLGAICILGAAERMPGPEAVELVRIFARHIAGEVEMRQAEERLAEASRMELIGQLAGGVAHEVRNPLNALMAITEAITTTLGPDPSGAELLGHMRMQIDRLATLMSDLLELGRPVERAGLVREPIGGLVAASLDVWRSSPQAAGRAVRYAPDPAAAGSEVLADPGRFQQVLVNLLDNAAAHSPQDSDIAVELGLGHRGEAVVRVIDRGGAIPPEHLPRVFEAFFTLRRGGTGLGLSIVKHIVEAHGGTVSLRNNTPEAGCTAEVRIPLAGDAR